MGFPKLKTERDFYVETRTLNLKSRFSIIHSAIIHKIFETNSHETSFHVK